MALHIAPLAGRHSPIRPLVILLLVTAAVLAGGCGNDDIDRLANEIHGGPSGPPYNLGNDVLFPTVTSPRSGGSFQGYPGPTVPKPTYLLSISAIIALCCGSADMKMALYTDAGGVPGTLVAASNPQTLVIGVNEFPVPVTYLPPGAYWIISHPSTTYQTYYQGGATTTLAFFTYPFANPFPGTFPVFTPSSTNPVNYYITVAD